MPGLIISNELSGDKSIIRGLQSRQSSCQCSSTHDVLRWSRAGVQRRSSSPGGERGNFLMHTHRQLLLPLPQRLPTIVWRPLEDLWRSTDDSSIASVGSLCGRGWTRCFDLPAWRQSSRGQRLLWEILWSPTWADRSYKITSSVLEAVLLPLPQRLPALVDMSN